ncbi:hypothetical protein C0992_009167 [Termitomyces sp. T32_za158]|nr:hypothetical protein C0992_009167 [Termitomyces sp. T32_za158]
MDVNALNYCRFSLLPDTSDEAQALVALPNLVDSASASHDEPSSSASGCALKLLCAYESGSVTLRRYTRTDKPTSVEGAGWEIIWDVKLTWLHISTLTSPLNRVITQIPHTSRTELSIQGMLRLQFMITNASVPSPVGMGAEMDSLGDEAQDSDVSEEMDEREEEERTRWLAIGGKDYRVSIWALMNFTK